MPDDLEEPDFSKAGRPTGKPFYSITCNFQDHSKRLIAYVLAAEAVETLEEAGYIALADNLRDATDPLWWALTEAEHDLLNRVPK